MKARFLALIAHGVFGFDGDDAARLTEIRNILSDAEQVAALSDDELSGLHVELNEIADRILDGTADGIERYDTERLTEIAESVEQIRTTAAARVEEQARREEEVAALMARIRPAAEDGDGEGDGEDGEGDGADAPADPATADAAPAPAADAAPVPAAVAADAAPAPAPAAADAPADAAPVAVTASSRPTLQEIAARVPRAQRPSTDARPRFGLARTEHPFIRAIQDGGHRVTVSDMAELMCRTYNDFVGVQEAGGGIQKIRLGRIELDFPEDRVLRSGDSEMANMAKIDAVTADAWRPELWTPAIVATGGFCAPTEALYDIEQISGAQRPLRDSLPSFQADRGGIRFNSPPNLSQVLVDVAGGAVGEWTNTTDITPGESTKTCQSIACGAIQEVLTKAIYRCIGVGNFGARAFPENVRAWTLNVASAWARKAEQEILDSVSASSTALTSTGIYGFVSELLTHIIQLAAGERSRQRMDPAARLRVWLPAWVPAQMQIDRLRQGSVETRVLPVAEIRSMFDAVGVNVTFYEDSRTGAGQVVGAQAAAELRDLPEVVEWYLFHEGAWTHLTGGVLDLGLVRDSTRNETNDFRIFFEEWAEVAFRGIFSYRVRSTLCPNGERSALLDGDPCGVS